MKSASIAWKATLLCAATTTICAATAQQASAGGFSSARFGGEHGNPAETNPESIYYNPAGFGLSKGTHLTLDSSFVWRSATYDRPAPDASDVLGDTSDADLTARAIAANSGEARLDNFLISPMLGVTSDLGLDLPLTVGAGFYAPFGGQAVWGTVEDDPDFPGAQDGSQRWYTIDGTIRTLAYSLGAAWRFEGPRLSLGLSGNLYQHDVHTIRARNPDGGEGLQDSAGNIQEGRSRLEVSGLNFGLAAGLLWEAMPKQLWLGLSYQSQPGFGTMELKGDLTNVFGPSEPQDPQDAILRQELPDVIRLGARYRPMDELELRLSANYTRWSVFEEQCVVNADASDPEGACKAVADGGSDSAVILYLPRNWDDTYGVNLGASYWVLPELELIVGGGFDSNAIPDGSLEPALFDMDKFTASAGVRYDFTENVGLMVTGTNVFYSERDTTGTITAEVLQPPARQPSSAGVYKQNIFLLNTNLALSF